MKQTLLSIIAACGLAVASSTNNSTNLSANTTSQPFELIFPNAEPTKQQPWTVKVVLSRINTKKSRFTGPSTTNATVSLTGNKMLNQDSMASEIVPASTKIAQSGPYNAVTFELGFNDKYTGNDKRISDAMSKAHDMLDQILGGFGNQVDCTLFDDKGRKITLSLDPSDRGSESPSGTSEVRSADFTQYRAVGNSTEKLAKIGARTYFFVWGTQAVTNVTCTFAPPTFQDVQDMVNYHVTLEDKPDKAGSNLTSKNMWSYTMLKQNYSSVSETAPAPPSDPFESNMFKPIFPLPPKASNESVAKPDGSPQGKLSGLKTTAVGVIKKVSTLRTKQEYNKVTMEVGEALRPDSRCQIVDPTGKTISVAGEDGKAVTTFAMGRYTFHEPKRSAVGKIRCSSYLGQ